MQQLTDPWSDADLASLAELERADARTFAARCAVLARMTACTSARELGWAGHAPWDSLLMEVAGSSRIGQHSAGSRLTDAEHLVERLPGTHTALAQGRLFVPQARVLLQETRDLDAATCAAVEDAVLPTAHRYAPADLRPKVQRAVLRADPATAEERHRTAKDRRRTWIQPAADGMAEQGALLTATQARRFDADLTALLGRATPDATDLRTADQKRADVLADLPGLALELLDRLDGVLPPEGFPQLVDQYLPDTPNPTGSRPHRRRRRRTQVLVRVPVCSVVGLSDEPAWLDGYGWITADQARTLLPEAELRKASIDLETGRLLHLGPPVQPAQVRDALRRMIHEPTVVGPNDPSRRVELQHDPSDALREHVDHRDERCDGPGCGVPSTMADLDHTVPYPSGPTSADNLACRSERCHQAKHHGWTVRTDSRGVSTWTSPYGRSYQRWPRDEPPPRLRPRRHDPSAARRPTTPPRVAPHQTTPRQTTPRQTPLRQTAPGRGSSRPQTGHGDDPSPPSGD